MIIFTKRPFKPSKSRFSDSTQVLDPENLGLVILNRLPKYYKGRGGRIGLSHLKRPGLKERLTLDLSIAARPPHKSPMIIFTKRPFKPSKSRFSDSTQVLDPEKLGLVILHRLPKYYKGRGGRIGLSHLKRPGLNESLTLDLSSSAAAPQILHNYFHETTV